MSVKSEMELELERLKSEIASLRLGAKVDGLAASVGAIADTLNRANEAQRFIPPQEQQARCGFPERFIWFAVARQAGIAEQSMDFSNQKIQRGGVQLLDRYTPEDAATLVVRGAVRPHRDEAVDACYWKCESLVHVEPAPHLLETFARAAEASTRGGEDQWTSPDDHAARRAFLMQMQKSSYAAAFVQALNWPTRLPGDVVRVGRLDWMSVFADEASARKYAASPEARAAKPIDIASALAELCPLPATRAEYDRVLKGEVDQRIAALGAAP